MARAGCFGILPGNTVRGDWPSIPHYSSITMEKHAGVKPSPIIKGSEKVSLITNKSTSVLDVATYLLSKGIGKNDRIIPQRQKLSEWAIAYLGILFCKATVVPLDNQMATERVEALSAFSEAKGFFGDRDVIERLAGGAWPDSQAFFIYLDAEGDEQGTGFAQIPTGDTSIEASELPSGEDIAAILYTSGTTGHEKGVILTHANFTSDVYQAGDPEFLAISSEDIFYALLPLHHSYTMTAVFLESLMHGCELLFGQGIVVSGCSMEMRVEM